MTNDHEQEAQVAVDITAWLTTGQAARALGVSTRRVVQLADAGKLGFIRTNHGRLFDPDAIAERRERIQR